MNANAGWSSRCERISIMRALGVPLKEIARREQLSRNRILQIEKKCQPDETYAARGVGVKEGSWRFGVWHRMDNGDEVYVDGPSESLIASLEYYAGLPPSNSRKREPDQPATAHCSRETQGESMSRTRAVQVPGMDAPQADKTDGPATAPVEFTKGPEPVAGLRAADVDPNKLKRAVLTLDGWVCPAVAPGFAEER